MWYLADAFRLGLDLEEVFSLTYIDPWFLAQVAELVEVEKQIEHHAKRKPPAENLRAWKRKGFSDRRLAQLLGVTEEAGARVAPRRQGAAGIQARGFLRRRVRLGHGLYVLHL